MREIALIGMGCRFPESPDLGGYWRTIRAARVGFRDVPPDRWDLATFHSDDRREPDKTYGRKMGLVEDIRSFAPEFYAISPRRARVMDPQQRLLLDVTRDALEDAGYGRRALPSESTGVFVGATVSEHKDIITSRVQVPRALSRAFGRVPALSPEARAAMVEDLVPMQAGTMVGQLLIMIAANVAQAFDLRGPAFAVDTACSSALVALHEAVLHLRAGLIDAAVVGGVYLNLDCVNPVCFSRIGALSPSDRCRPFDADGDGFVLGEGAGTVVLKRLDQAIRDGDRVWGVIRGIALNNDGRSDGPMAPRPEGQSTVLRRAYRDAGLTPDVVGFIEAHGTATAAGDRAEIAALKEAFETERAGPIDCAVGSVKANIGHTLAAAGVAGLIKAALAIEHGVIPPQAGFDAPHPDLGLDGIGFWIPREERPWPVRAGSARYAAVSAFGFGGTNVHVVLESPPAPTRVRVHARPGTDRPSPIAEPFLIAAPTPEQLIGHLGELEAAIGGLDGRASLADLAYTLSATRRHGRLRVAFGATSHAELLRKLAAARAAVQAGSTADAGLWIGQADPETVRTELPAPPHGEDGEPDADAAETRCARAVRGQGPDPVAWFAGRDVRPVWLPHAPMAARPFWAVRSGRKAPADLPAGPHADVVEESSDIAAVPPPVREEAPEVADRVAAAVAHVGSYAPDRLRGDQQIMADLGFDSLMVVDLLNHLEKTFPALAGRCDDLIERDLTVDALAAIVAAKLGEPGRRRPPVIAPSRVLRPRLRDEAPAPPPTSMAIEPSRYRFEDFPEVRALRDRLDGIRAQGLDVPYFRVHDGVTRNSTVIAGRHYINFSSYNYLGLSGDPEVTRAAAMAAVRYGTSVSASRVASGERPVHRELEAALARFLGCEDAIVMVSGHATNVSVLGHLLGPEDLIVHDALAHDSILGGARLSGARRRPFAHNNMDALEDALASMRAGARRVLIAVEGVYSMDGDLAPLDRLVELKRKYRALLLVDEAHSLGVVGRTGRGIGEHYGVDRGDVDLWMGTLSKSLASCGGYIAGSSAVVDYLKYSAPGFVYSVGLSPANAAAALAALEKLEARPGLVERLRERSRLFLELCRDRGLDTGLSDGSAVVPCIVGDSSACLRLSEALAVRGINVQPILAPAVAEHQARLRFFITARHTEDQLVATADALAREWARLDLDTADFAAEAVA